MTNEIRTLDSGTISKLVLAGDMKGLTDAQKVEYYNYRCQQAGLDPAAKPFDLLTLNGKMILYANAACTQQLTSNRKLSHQVTNRELVDGIYCVFVRVTDSEGRSTENMGAVPIDALKGEAKANAMLKATTKAIRRAVLAHCGLGMMDETEVETIPGAVTTTPTLPPPPAFEPKEWTDEERSEAMAQIGDIADILMSWDVSEEDIQKAIDRPRGMIGDEATPYETWSNRLITLQQRLEKKYKKAS